MNKGQVYGFDERLFIRAPFYSFEHYALGAAERMLSETTFRNALYLASPSFYAELEKLNFDWKTLTAKQKLTLKKYYNRMSFRPTPFGAFSSFGLAHWQDRGSGLRLAASAQSVLHLLPSREWQVAASHAQGQQDKPALLLRTNPTLFSIPGGFRYVRSSFERSGKGEFAVNELPDEALHREVIQAGADQPVTRIGLQAMVAEKTGCSLREAKDYVNFLISEQVLITELEGALISGHHPGGTGIPDSAGTDHAMRSFWQHSAASLFDVKLSLPERAAMLSDLNRKAGIPFSGNALYGGLERGIQSGGIDRDKQQSLLSTIEILQKIVIPYPTPALKNFIRNFKERFDSQPVPLLRAVDPDNGVGYGDLHGQAQTGGLLNHVAFPEKAKTAKAVEWTPVHRLFLRLWLQNTSRGPYDPVHVNAKDTADLKVPEEYALPPTLAVMFSCSGDDIVLDNLGGASATSLIGRFSVFSAEIETLCNWVAAEESRANPDIMFAEVHQLSDTHVDNINRRSPVYDAAIHINTFPAETGQLQVPLSDLILRMAGEKLILESVSLGRRIIPRLPTAYNYQHNPLALFQFLCDLQYEGLQANLTFDLEKLFPGLDFYPRVVSGKVVISLARWRLSDAEVQMLLSKPYSIGRLHLFRAERGIPQLVSLGLSDQQLVFDLGDDEEALFFLDCLKDTRSAVIREYLQPNDAVQAEGKAFAAQLVAVLLRPDPVYKGTKVRYRVTKEIQRDFLPGSEWLYLKIYTTEESADRLLTSAVLPFLDKYRKQVRLWFFIRYRDPEPHIRLRIRSAGGGSGPLLNAIRKIIARQHALVKDVKQEIYRREIERYSPELIETAELLFQAGSLWTLEKLSGMVESPPKQTDIEAFVLVYRMTAAFISEKEAIGFFNRRSESFFKEFGPDKALRISMDTRYRAFSRDLSRAVADVHTGGTNYKKGQDSEILKIMQVLSGATTHWNTEKRYAFLADLLHMQVNRMFSTRQRQHEALIFYCLYKSCSGRQARIQKQGSVPGALADQH